MPRLVGFQLPNLTLCSHLPRIRNFSFVAALLTSQDHLMQLSCNELRFFKLMQLISSYLILFTNWLEVVPQLI